MAEVSGERCNGCGYTEEDARINGDHRLCKYAGNAPWEKRPAEPSPTQREPEISDYYGGVVTPEIVIDVPCLDCGRPYPHGLDMVLTKKQWRMVNPDDGGVLCPSCIVNRAAELPGSISVYAFISFSEDHDGNTDSIEKMLVALRLENADYCREVLEAKHRIVELERDRDVADSTQNVPATQREPELWRETQMEWPKGLSWNYATQSWDYVFRGKTIDSMNGEFAASNPILAKSWEKRLDALTAAYVHVESMHVHISHGGPTRADGERLLGQLRNVLLGEEAHVG